MPDRDGGWWTISNIFLGATVLRVSLLVYGLLQDARSAVPYTDVDYCVFTDAARFVWHGQSPYARDTYRYSPLLAWILVPTAWTFGPGSIYFAWGKVLFAAADLAAGWLALRVLVGRGSSLRHSLQVVGSTWLLNPMVATISTRGSSEALLGVLVTLLLWAALQRRLVLAGALLGLSVHLKIYPFIYGAAILLQLDTPPHSGWMQYILVFPTRSRMTFILTSLTTFMLLNGLMYGLYGQEFVQHTYLHHLTRIDHRHNFSPYNTLLHLSSALGSRRGIEKLAFVPQLGLSLFIIPLVLARKDLGGTMLCQTWAFVTFNKVVTSQYFLWYIVLLPFYLPYSSFLASPQLGLTALILWALGQALWLHQAYRLEFLGHSTFFPELFGTSLLFFAINCWILGIMVRDVGQSRKTRQD